MKKFIFLVAFRTGETRTVTVEDTTVELAKELAWQKLPGVDQDRNPTFELLTNSQAAAHDGKDGAA